MQSERISGSMMRGAFAVVVLATLVEAQGVFWVKVDTHRIQWAEGEGSQIQTVVANKVDGGAEIVVDPGSGKIYWADNEGAAIRRANLDGSNFAELVSQNVLSLAICIDAGQLFWSDWHTGQIKRANLDGSQVEVIVPDATTMFGALQHVAVDCAQGKLYWTEFTSNQQGRIHRANLDGSGRETISGGGRPYQIRMAESLAKFYWADWESGGIYRANLDGSNVEHLATTAAGFVRGFSLDQARNKMYWLVQVESGSFPASLWQSDLNGNGVQQLALNLETGTRFNGLAVDPSSGDLFWNVRQAFEQNLGRMERVNIGNLQRITVFTQAFGDMGALALDPRPGGRIYFADWRYNVIRSSNLNGADLPSILSITAYPGLVGSLAFDTNRNQLYFGRGNCDDLIGSIERINTDGSGYTTIISPLYCPGEVEYDPLGDKLYWTEYYPLRIQRADPDTPGFRETLVVSPENGLSGGLALDAQAGKVYWVVILAAVFDSKIYRANLDGSQVEEIANSTHEIGGVTVDSQAGKLYWTEHDAIRVANLDGSNVQDFRIDPVEPRLLGDIIVDSRHVICTRTPLYADITGLPASVDFGDVSAVVDAFRGVESVSPGSLCDLYPCDPLGNRCLGDGVIDFRDISQAVDAFKGIGCS